MGHELCGSLRAKYPRMHLASNSSNDGREKLAVGLLTETVGYNFLNATVVLVVVVLCRRVLLKCFQTSVHLF